MSGTFKGARASFQGVMYDMNEEQWETYNKKKTEDNKFWGLFWVKVMKDNGLSNVEIARRVELSETTIRRMLKQANGEVPKKDADGLSVHARLYDKTCLEWHNNPEYNRTLLLAQENFANHKLRRDGFLFLNDVYNMLGLDKTSAGQLVGWLWWGDGDNYVDFGLTHPRNTDAVDIWLDFNVDGVIYDKIDEINKRVK